MSRYQASDLYFVEISYLFGWFFFPSTVFIVPLFHHVLLRASLRFEYIEHIE